MGVLFPPHEIGWCAGARHLSLYPQKQAHCPWEHVLRHFLAPVQVCFFQVIEDSDLDSTLVSAPWHWQLPIIHKLLICLWLECTIWVGIQMNAIVFFWLSPRSRHQWTYTITLKVLLNNLPIFHFVARFYVACWPNMAFGMEYYLWISHWLKLLRWSAPWNPWSSHNIYPNFFGHYCHSSHHVFCVCVFKKKSSLF